MDCPAKVANLYEIRELYNASFHVFICLFLDECKSDGVTTEFVEHLMTIALDEKNHCTLFPHNIKVQRLHWFTKLIHFYSQEH